MEAVKGYLQATGVGQERGLMNQASGAEEQDEVRWEKGATSKLKRGSMTCVDTGLG